MIKYTLELNSEELYMLQSAMSTHIGYVVVDLKLGHGLRSRAEMLEQIDKYNALLDNLYKGM